MQSISDKPVLNANGFLILGFIIVIDLFITSLLPLQVSGPVAISLSLILISGFTIIGPNESKVITFFGKYIGTIKNSGFIWTVPLSNATLVPLKIINFNTNKLKVNDLSGNPIEVGAIVVWWVKDSAQACFNVDDYKSFIFNQSESVVRTIAAKYPYDSADRPSLRGNAEEIIKELIAELKERLAAAGIEVEEVKLSHLAYAPEIASAMLKRQQAVAILEARKYLIENAAIISEGVIDNFVKKGMSNISDDKKVEVMSNIMITMISEQQINPIIDVG